MSLNNSLSLNVWININDYSKFIDLLNFLYFEKTNHFIENDFDDTYMEYFVNTHSINPKLIYTNVVGEYIQMTIHTQNLIHKFLTFTALCEANK